jgi:hypothetical protein
LRAGDGAQQLVLEDVVLALGERPPGFDLHVVLLQECLGLDLLVKGVGSDLVDRRDHLIMHEQIHHTVGLEVADADRPHPALLVQLLHRAACAVHVAEGLVDQVEVQHVELEPLQRTLEGLLRAVVASILDPELGGDEDLLAGDVGALDRVADRGLVAIGCGGVD